jgi:hypothetical protein
MTGILHMRVRNGRKRYRVFSATSNAYVTSECSEQQARRYMLDEAVKQAQREIDQAVTNANARGTSLPFANGYDLAAPWLGEDRPQIQQHSFEPMRGGLRCSWCGDMENATVHTRGRTDKKL